MIPRSTSEYFLQSLLIIKVSLYFLSIRKCCIEYPIKILRLARSGVIKFLTRI